jgi:hypothetical protein
MDAAADYPRDLGRVGITAAEVGLPDLEAKLKGGKSLTTEEFDLLVKALDQQLAKARDQQLLAIPVFDSETMSQRMVALMRRVSPLGCVARRASIVLTRSGEECARARLGVRPGALRLCSPPRVCLRHDSLLQTGSPPA